MLENLGLNFAKLAFLSNSLVRVSYAQLCSCPQHWDGPGLVQQTKKASAQKKNN